VLARPLINSQKGGLNVFTNLRTQMSQEPMNQFFFQV